jgi:hypothetical protein
MSTGVWPEAITTRSARSTYDWPGLATKRSTPSCLSSPTKFSLASRGSPPAGSVALTRVMGNGAYGLNAAGVGRELEAGRTPNPPRRSSGARASGDSPASKGVR